MLPEPETGRESLAEERYGTNSQPSMGDAAISTPSSLMAALLTFFFLRLGDLDLTPTFLYISQLCALKSQENFGCQWFTLPKLGHFSLSFLFFSFYF